MTIRVHYGTQSYIVKESDPAVLAQEAFEILTSSPQMSGIWNLETTSGEVYLLLTRNTPIAVEDYDEVLAYQANSMDFSEIPANSMVSGPDD